MRISDILAHKGHHIFRARSNETVGAAVARLSEHNIGALLVEDSWGKYVGLFSERHFVHGLDRYGAEVLERPVGELTIPDRISCHPGDRVSRVMELMTVHRIRHMPVEADGATIGIVSIGDLVRGILSEKELEVDVLRDMAQPH